MRHDIWLGLRKVSQQLDQVVKYESGELDEPTTIALFQSLIESGLVWSLPGNYGRTATELIALGVCVPSRTTFIAPSGGHGMIDYERLERGASGVDRSAQPHKDGDQLTAYKLENTRLKEVIDVQKAEIRRLMRLLGIGLQQS
jgi:hypothetical protein